MNNHNLPDKSVSDSLKVESEQGCFHLMLFSESEEMTELWLPENPEGFFRV